MNRRKALKTLSSIAAGSCFYGLPIQPYARQFDDGEMFSGMSVKELFNQALESEPSLIGFSNVESNYPLTALTLEGDLPVDIQGYFYRNGPAKLERGDIRYQHLFEGDGMMQQFCFSEGKVTHQGKFIETEKYINEDAASQFLYSGPDTKLKNSLPVISLDSINTANTSMLAVGDDLWALWEAGSPIAMNPRTLETKGVVNLGESGGVGKLGRFSQSLKGLPFSAHPKVEPNGDIWNFGLKETGHIVLFHLNSNGKVKNVAVINAQYKCRMLHDFLITEKHILLILPSLYDLRNEDTSSGYFSGIRFEKEQPMRVLVVDKANLRIKRQYELPAAFAFHFGNAWEDFDGTIHFDASLYANVDVLDKLAMVMKGDCKGAKQVTRAKTALFTLYTNGAVTRNILQTNNEFPRVFDQLIGKKSDRIFHLSGLDNALWSHQVCSLNMLSGEEDMFDFGCDFLVEEHICIASNLNKGGYLLGTALHVPSQRTCLNVFLADNISAGPAVRAWLPYHLPIGFHGNFIST